MGTDRFTLMADMNKVVRKVRWDEISDWKNENMGVSNGSIIRGWNDDNGGAWEVGITNGNA